MNKDKYNIISGFIFPWTFQFMAGIVVMLSFTFTNTLAIPITLILLSLMVFGVHGGVEIDRAAKTYREYYALLFIKIGKPKPYESVEKIFVNSSRMSQRIYTPQTHLYSDFKSTEYNAYLKFGNGKKIYLLTKKKKDDLTHALKGIGHFLKTPVVDNTR